ncbi:cytochrome-b5 reductase [Aureococcus anophagefferens]|nr:cytochrome-b5 reductase [Aureococcus anophagefferens]
MPVQPRSRRWGVKPVAAFDSYAFRRSYRPEGAVSTFVHDREVGDAVEFKHVAENEGADRIYTRRRRRRFVLLYGNRSCEDILLRETLDAWAVTHADRLKVVYAVGSRWANVHCGMKTRVKRDGFSTTADALAAPPSQASGPADVAEPGARGRWVGRACIEKHAFAPSPDTLTFVCGLPSVYDSLCGPRGDPEVTGVLRDLGYAAADVVKRGLDDAELAADAAGRARRAARQPPPRAAARARAPATTSWPAASTARSHLAVERVEDRARRVDGERDAGHALEERAVERWSVGPQVAAPQANRVEHRETAAAAPAIVPLFAKSRSS